jgi:hypothetical protein
LMATLRPSRCWCISFPLRGDHLCRCLLAHCPALGFVLCMFLMAFHARGWNFLATWCDVVMRRGTGPQTIVAKQHTSRAPRRMSRDTDLYPRSSNGHKSLRSRAAHASMRLPEDHACAMVPVPVPPLVLAECSVYHADGVLTSVCSASLKCAGLIPAQGARRASVVDLYSWVKHEQS